MRDRYSIYSMIDKVVRFKLPTRLGGKSGDGVVSDVYRDALNHRIEITIGKKTFVFREPTAVERSDDDPNIIWFVYGNPEKATDEQFLEENRKASIKGLGAEDAFKAVDRDFFRVKFQIHAGQVVKQKKKKRRKK